MAMQSVDPVEIRTPLEQLRRERAELIADLRVEFANLVNVAAGSTDDEHDPDGSTVAYERSRVGALLEQARRSLEEVDAAFERLDKGRYGVCEKCGVLIASERLEALPTTATCIVCAKN
jgi:RNA polymerase-binding transcription factor DksA